jgi:hypothetical protein
MKNKKLLILSKIRYKCGFCGKEFKSCSSCAKHIEKKSYLKLCFPQDIEVIYGRYLK